MVILRSNWVWLFFLNFLDQHILDTFTKWNFSTTDGGSLLITFISTDSKTIKFGKGGSPSLHHCSNLSLILLGYFRRCHRYNFLYSLNILSTSLGTQQWEVTKGENPFISAWQGYIVYMFQEKAKYSAASKYKVTWKTVQQSKVLWQSIRLIQEPLPSKSISVKCSQSRWIKLKGSLKRNSSFDLELGMTRPDLSDYPSSSVRAKMVFCKSLDHSVAGFCQNPLLKHNKSPPTTNR